MKKYKKISASNIPGKIPLHLTLTALLAIKIYRIPDFWIGVISIFFALIWIGWIVEVIKKEEIDLFDKGNS